MQARLKIAKVILLGRWTAGARRQFRHAIAFPLPDSEQQHFASAGIPEDVEHILCAVQLKKARAPRIRARWRAGTKKQTQFRDLLRCMTPEIFEKGRLFCSCKGHDVFPPHES